MLGHLNIRILGRTQGVLFRLSAKKKADELKVFGFARNEKDGSVYIEAEGDLSSLEDFVGWCKKGPPLALVRQVEVNNGKVKGFERFKAVS